MMTRKHFEAVAEALRNVPRNTDNAQITMTERDVMNALGVVFEQENPRFDFPRFVAAATR